MSDLIEQNKIQWHLYRTFMGIMAAGLGLFLYAEYLRFLLQAEFSLPFRVLIFVIGQFICLMFFIWSGVLISKYTTCPQCHKGLLIFPISDLCLWLPALPFSAKFLANFTVNKKESFILSDFGYRMKGICRSCCSCFELAEKKLLVISPGMAPEEGRDENYTPC